MLVWNLYKKEIDKLHMYVDNRIEEASLAWLCNALGTTNPPAGLLGLAERVAYYENPKEGLDALQEDLIVKYKQFVDDSDHRVASYEKKLPLFRQFGELLVTTLVEEIALYKKKWRP